MNNFIAPLASILHYRQDLWQFLRAMFSPLLLLLPFVWLPQSTSGVILLWIAIWLSVAKLNYILHNHVHLPFTRFKRLNRWLDWSLGFCTGMTAGNWRLTHVHAHHVEHLKESLPSRREFFDYQEHETVYTFGNAALHCISSAGPQFWLPVKAGWTKGIRSKSFRSPLYRYVFWENITIYSIVLALFIYSPFVTSLFILLPYALVYIISRHIDFITHTDIEDERYGYATVCVIPKYNSRYWNFGYHIAHHENPKLHWSELPAAFAKMNMEPVPDARIKRLPNIGIFPDLLYTEWCIYRPKKT